MDYNKVPLTDADIVNRAIKTLTGNERRWLLWRLEDGGKKIPYTKYNKYASTTNPDDWLTYEDVQEGLASDGEYSGIGIVLDGTVLGVDLDDCLNESHELINPLLEAFVVAANTYTEISPSGTGLHLLFKLSTPVKWPAKRHGSIEVYTQQHYLTFTKNLYVANLVRTISPDEALNLLGTIGYPWSPVDTSSQIASKYSFVQSTSDYEAVKQKMFSSKHGTEIEALYNGDTSQYGGDVSRAEAGLVKHLAYWADNDRDAVRSLWLSSPLAQRDKTQLRDDYVERTLNFSVASSNVDIEHQITTSTPLNGSEPSLLSDQSVRNAFLAVETDMVDFLKRDIQVVWDVEQLITQGSLNMIASPPHQGKTFIALHIALCLAHGLSVFGKFKVPQAKNVIIINEEDVPAEIQGRLKSMAPKSCDKGRITLYPLTGQKVSPEWADVVIERAQAHNVGLVILDNLAASSLANENEAHAMQAVMDCFRKIMKAGITVIFIHHDRKGQSADDAPSLDRARGSGVIAAAVHGYLSVQSMPDDQFKISQLKLKANVAKVKPFVVKMDTTVTADANFRYEFEYLGDYNAELTAVDKMQDKVMRFCRSKGPLPFTRKTLVSAGVTKSTEDRTFRDALDWMVKNGYLTSQKLSDLAPEKYQLLDEDTHRKNTLVFTATLKLLDEDGGNSSLGSDQDLSNIPF